MANYLVHYGIEGQKWGERRYQYEDGSYTPEGKRRYGIGDGRKYTKVGDAPRMSRAERKEATTQKVSELRKQADDIDKRLNAGPDAKIVEKYFKRPPSEVDYDDDDFVDVPEKVEDAFSRWRDDNIKGIRESESIRRDANSLEGNPKSVSAAGGAFVGAMASLPLMGLTKIATIGMKDGAKRTVIVGGVALSSIAGGAIWGMASDKKLQKDAQKKYGLR